MKLIKALSLTSVLSTAYAFQSSHLAHIQKSSIRLHSQSVESQGEEGSKKKRKDVMAFLRKKGALGKNKDFR